MSIKKKYVYECDVCGIEIERKVRIQVQIYGQHNGYNSFKTEDTYDLCDKCSKKVMTFIQNLRKEDEGK